LNSPSNKEFIVNTLIIGGCFLIALLALIGLVWAIRGDPAPPAASKALEDNAEPAGMMGGVAGPVSKEPSPLATQKLRNHHTPLVTQKLAHERTSVGPTQEEWQQDTIGQFRELSTELHVLHQQAQQIEQRLSILTEVVERLEHSENGQISVEEGTAHRPGTTSTY